MTYSIDFLGKCLTTWKKIRSIAHTVCTNYRWINLNIYFLTCYKKISENIFIILGWGWSANLTSKPEYHKGKDRHILCEVSAVVSDSVTVWAVAC